MKVAVNGKVVDIEVNGTIPDAPVYVQIKELKQKLADTDYQAIKFAEGELTESEYAPTKAQRKAWRDRINELEKVSSGGIKNV